METQASYVFNRVIAFDPKKRLGFTSQVKLPEYLESVYERFYTESLTKEKILASIACKGLKQNLRFREWCRSVFIGVSRIPLYMKQEDTSWTKYHRGSLLPGSARMSDKGGGVQYETITITEFEMETGYTVFRCGNIVNPWIPWMMCLPDGIIFTGSDVLILEIKTTFIHTLETFPYFNENKELRKTNDIYCQIQFSMFISNIHSTLLIVNFVDTGMVTNKWKQIIYFDADYIRVQFETLETLFIETVFPHILCNASSVLVDDEVPFD